MRLRDFKKLLEKEELNDDLEVTTSNGKVIDVVIQNFSGRENLVLIVSSGSHQ